MRPSAILFAKTWVFGVVSALVLLAFLAAASSLAEADDAMRTKGVTSPTVSSENPTSTFRMTAESQAATPAPATPGEPTLAVPEDRAAQPPATPPAPAPVSTTTTTEPSTATSAAKSTDTLEPIAEPDPTVPPKVDTAGFNGVVPGRSTMAQVAKQWGPAKETREQDGVTIHRYVIKPFDQVELVASGDKVASIVVRFEKAFPAKIMAEQLGLTNIRPVLVSNELGDILGQAFPEQGVMFAFQQGKQPGQPSMQVSQIVLEPVAADPFVLRAETNLATNFKQNLHDLDEAIKLAPNHGRAHWLRSRVLAAMGRSDEAVEASRRAIEIEGDNARFRVSHAQILSQAGGLHEEAVAETARAIAMSDSRPHVKARAQCLMGDLLADAPEPDWATALKFHMAAVKTAEPLAADRHPAVRLAAKEVLIDAHLGAANDIAWGRFGGKEKAVAEWTRRASALTDELIASDGGTKEHQFRVASRTLGALVGLQGKMDPTDWVREAVRVGDEMIDAAPEADEKQQMRWELGMALFNAVQIYQARKQLDYALECGQEATAYLEPAKEAAPLAPEQQYLLGRLYFRLGAIHAVNRGDHASAVAWFDKAAGLLDAPFSKRPDAELGRQGETLVSMGVSYWEANQQDKAMQLTRGGLAMMKESVAAGAMTAGALSVPYDNLATMQKHLGHAEEAEQMTQLANDARTAREPANQTSTAKKPGETIQR
ncbi:MAG TPA: tetratricopeptide repeat protein [Thermoguttaceae bacterium]|nr:tetratricopeptide repeat protein [Thermoguttaceae bacterium]